MIDINNITLETDDLNTYREKGYFVTSKIFEDSEIEKLRNSFDRIFDNDYDRDIYPFDRVYNHGIDNKLLFKLNNGWWVNDEIRSVIWPLLFCFSCFRHCRGNFLVLTN